MLLIVAVQYELMTSNVTLRKNSRTKIGKLHSTIFSLLNNENLITVLELLFVTLCNDGIKSQQKFSLAAFPFDFQTMVYRKFPAFS